MGRVRGGIWGLALASLVSLAAACTYDVPDVATDAAAITDSSVRDERSTVLPAEGGAPDTSIAIDSGDAAGVVDAGEGGVVDSGAHDGAADTGDGAVAPGCDAGAITFRDSSKFKGTVSAIPVPAPSSVKAGDLLIAYLTSSSAMAAALSYTAVPQGWTPGPVATQQGYYLGTAVLAVYTKLATASEPATYSWTVSRSAETEAWILAYAGVSQTSPLDGQSAAAQNVFKLSFPVPTLTTTSAGDLLIATFSSSTGPPATGWIQPSGTNQRANNVDGNSMAGASYDLVQGAAGATPVVSSFPQGVTSADVNTVITHIIALRACP